jgi:hypothetical protein
MLTIATEQQQKIQARTEQRNTICLDIRHQVEAQHDERQRLSPVWHNFFRSRQQHHTSHSVEPKQLPIQLSRGNQQRNGSWGDTNIYIY